MTANTSASKKAKGTKMKDIKKEFMEKFKVGDNLATFCCGGDLCEGHLDDLEELWAWIESKLNEEIEKSYLQGLKEGTDLAEERIQKEREKAIKSFIDGLHFNTYYDQDDLLSEYLSQTKGGKNIQMTLQNEIENILESVDLLRCMETNQEHLWDSASYECLVKRITTLIQDREKKLLDRVEVLIAEEMIIAQKEGQSTSRLTSLAVKLKELK